MFDGNFFLITVYQATVCNLSCRASNKFKIYGLTILARSTQQENLAMQENTHGSKEIFL